MTTKPTNITSKDSRSLSSVIVPKSGNKDVEREHQNRINKHFDDRIEELEVSGGGTTVVGGGDGNHSTLTADPTNFVLTDSGDRNYHIDIKTGGIGSTELASTAVTAGDYGDDDQSPTFTVDADGRLTSAADVHIPITVYLTAAENLSARDFVSIDSSGDVIQADATSINTAAIGYVKSAFSSSAATKVYLNKGILSGFTGLSIGKKYFLSASTPGGIVLQPTLTGTKVCQFVGTAISSTELSVDIDEAYRLYSNLTVSGTFGNTNVGSPMADSLTITGGVPPYTLLAGWTAPSGSTLSLSTATITDTGATDTVNTGQTYSGVVKDSEGAEAPFSGSVDVAAAVAPAAIYIGGLFTDVGGTTMVKAAKLDPDDGTLDTSFADPNITGGGGNVNGLSSNPDGDVAIAGNFVYVDGVLMPRGARLDSDGSLDTAFIKPDPYQYTIDCHLLDDGSIIFVGPFTSTSGGSRNSLAKFGPTGTLDTSYPQKTAGAQPSRIVPYGTGVIIGGYFTGIGGVTRNYIALIDSDGTVNTSFNPNANNAVTGLEVMSDSKVIAMGAFTSIGGISRSGIARLNTDGTGDSGFSVTTNGAVTCICEAAGGKYFIGGTFTTVDGSTRNHLARINSDGSLDTSWADPVVNGNVDGIAVLSSGKILIAGAFTQVNSVSRTRLARLNADGTLDTGYTLNVNGEIQCLRRGRA